MAEKGEENAELVLADFLPYRLYNASEKISSAFSLIYKNDQGLNRPEWRVLAVLAQVPKSNATEIGRLSSMHKTKVSRAVAALEARKWLRRWADENDRRLEWLELTKTGRGRFATLSALARDFEFKLHEALGAAAVANLERALGDLEAVTLPALRRTRAKAGT